MSRTAAAMAFALSLAACPGGSGDDEPDLLTITNDARPTKRSEVVSVADAATNKILMFGGNEAPIVNQIPLATYVGETWVFEPGSGWRWIDVDGPQARGRHGAALDPVQGRALMFGGRYRAEGQSGNYTVFDDLWAFDFETEVWEEIPGDGPAGRYYAQVVWSTEQNALFVYGGLTNADPLAFQRSDELWKWTDADGWEEIDTSGDAPSPRAFYGGTYDPTRDRLMLFAGQVGDFQSLAFNDLYALDLGTGEWEQLHGGGMGAPFTRMHPHLQWDEARDRVLLFGGHTDVGDDNDLWVFPGDGSQWEMIAEHDSFTGEGFGCLNNPTEVPADYVEQDLDAPERRQKAFLATMHDRLWLFGGMHAECSEHLDDTWTYELETNTWTELIEARTGESCLRRGEDCTCLCL